MIIQHRQHQSPTGCYPKEVSFLIIQGSSLSCHGMCDSVVTQNITVKLFVLHAAIEVSDQSFESAVCDCRLLSIFADALHPHQRQLWRGKPTWRGQSQNIRKHYPVKLLSRRDAASQWRPRIYNVTCWQMNVGQWRNDDERKRNWRQPPTKPSNTTNLTWNYLGMYWRLQRCMKRT